MNTTLMAHSRCGFPQLDDLDIGVIFAGRAVMKTVSKLLWCSF